MIYEKARELAQLINNSDYAKILEEAQLSGENLTNAQKEFNDFVNNTLNIIKFNIKGGETKDCGCGCCLKHI